MTGDALVDLRVGDMSFVIYECGNSASQLAVAGVVVGSCNDDGDDFRIDVYPNESAHEAAKLVTSEIMLSLGFALRAAQGVRCVKMDVEL